MSDPATLLEFGIGEERAVAYPPAEGYSSLRLAISEHLAQHGRDFDPKQIILTQGATMAIFVALVVLKLKAAQQGGSLRLHLLTPIWRVLVLNQAKILDVTVEEIPLTFADGAWTVPPLTFLHDAASPDIHVVFGAIPGNPTGCLIPMSSLQSPGVLRIVDVTYEAMIYAGDGHLDFSQVASQDDQTFVVGSFSKIFAIPGRRIGFLLCPPSFVTDAVDVLTAITMGVSVADQGFARQALRYWLDTGGTWFRPVRDELRMRAFAVYDALTKAGFQLAAPEAGYYAFAKMPTYVTESSIDFSERLLRYGVRVVPGDDFGGERFSRFLRLSFGNTKSLTELKEALGRIQQACADFRRGAA